MTNETTFYEECGIDATPFLYRQTLSQDGEVKKIKNAMNRDRKFQDERYSRDLPAHVIIDDYRRGAQSKEQTIHLLHVNCAKSRATSLFILDISGADEEHRRSLATLQLDETVLLILEGRYLCR